MPVRKRTRKLLPGWIDQVEDDCTRGVLSSFFLTILLAQEAGAEDSQRCRRILEEAFRTAPTKEELLAARSDAQWDRLCERIGKAAHLAARAEYCAERSR